MNIFEQLKKKISGKKAKISLIGLGYVGLPLAIEIAKKGFQTLGIDTNQDRIQRLKKYISYITDVQANDIKRVLKSNKFKPCSDFNLLSQSDIVLICVPTPLAKDKIPDLSYVIDAVRKITQYIKRGQLIILESTIYPGATEEVVLPILEKSGLRAGTDFYLAFSPERIDPGNKIYKIPNIPKVVGGINAKSTELAVAFYSQIISKVVPVSSTRVAEMVKLLENTFRIVNIALANEFASICYSFNLDPWEIIEAAKTKPFGFMPFYPGPGAGGHCIPVTPLFLDWKAKRIGYDSRLIMLSSHINQERTKFVANRISNLVSKKSKIILIGVTYKKDVRDLRDSPAIEIIDFLQKKGHKVDYYDPYITYLKINSINLKSIALTKKALCNAAAVVIITDHSSIDYKFIANNSNLIIDARNTIKNMGQKRGKIVKL